MREHTLLRACVAEVVGTFILVFFGVGSVHTAVLTGAQAGLWQVAVVWGVAIALAIYATGTISGAQMNPAITIACAVFRGFPARRVIPYLLAQLAGAVLAAATLYALFHQLIGQFEVAHHLVRGMPGSELSGMIYGEYFPNPALLGTTAHAFAALPIAQAMLAEGIGTALLAFFVFAVTDRHNPGRPHGTLAAVMIGLAVSIIISIIAPLTQAGLNPARDFGPRLFAYFAGWGAIAIPGARGGFFSVYILAPILGAQLGAAIYQFLLHPSFVAKKESTLQPASQPAYLFRPQTTDLQTTDSTNRGIIMPPVQLLLVGGFLGAGKTTLLARAARHLQQQGKRVGLITNDQAAQLVDTGQLRQAGWTVREISGGCFCCRFADLITAAERLVSELSLDILIGEPVGSCTDLSATVLQPLKDRYPEQFTVAPFSVMVDPFRLWEVLEPRRQSPLHASARYILRKQLEEADVILLNKVDLLSAEELRELVAQAAETFPDAPLRLISALTGEGVTEWLQEIFCAVPAGRHIVEVDYDTYAEGEAVLGWLNATVRLTATSAVDWQAFCTRLMNILQQAFHARTAEVGHLKCLLTTPEGSLTANLTRLASRPVLHGEVPGSTQAQLIINARVEMAPAQLRAIVEECLTASAGSDIALEMTSMESLSPGRPQPTYRYTAVV